MPETLGDSAIFSTRSVVHYPAAACFYEFEDLICEWLGATIIAPKDTSFPLRRKVGTVLHRHLGASKTAAALASPRLARESLEAEYDFFFSILPTPDYTHKLANFRDLRRSCRQMACYIPEVWAIRLRQNPHQLAPLSQFDQLFVSTLNAVEPLQRMTGVPCHFLPFAVDALKFSPLPKFPRRSIDVLSIGRRSSVTHQALLKAAKETDLFYQYDTSKPHHCFSYQEHRELLANKLKRTRYFISNIANFDELDKVGGAVEVGHRFYEGAAAGAVLMGYVPEGHEVIRQHFDWADALIRTEIDAQDIYKVMEDLDSQPERISLARAENVRNCLLRHDFVYRWEEVLLVMGREPTAMMEARKARLLQAADQVTKCFLEAPTRSAAE